MGRWLGRAVLFGAALALAVGAVTARGRSAAAPARSGSVSPSLPVAFDLSHWVGKGLRSMLKDPVLGANIRAALGERFDEVESYLPDLAHMRAEKGAGGFLVLAGGLDADRNGFLFVSPEGHTTLAFYDRDGERATVRLFSSDARYVSRVAPLLPEVTVWFSGSAPVVVRLLSPWELPAGGQLPAFLATSGAPPR